MKLLEREETTFSGRLWAALLCSLSYRAAMPVTKLMVFETGRRRDAYYVCPRCGLTMEREFMAYCDRCGQCLDWKGYKKAGIVYPGGKRDA